MLTSSLGNNDRDLSIKRVTINQKKEQILLAFVKCTVVHSSESDETWIIVGLMHNLHALYPD